MRKNLLVVCHANTARSVMAQVLLEKMLAERDADHSYRVRSGGIATYARDGMILVGGSNVYPAEVEAALDEHPAVASSCVIGLPDEEYGNAVHAIVQTRESLTGHELERFLGERLVKYKRPRTYEFVTTPLRGDDGKVRRTALRAQRLARRPGPAETRA